MLWLIIVVIVLMVIAIILGAVLGTFAHPNPQAAPEPSVTEIPADASPTTAPTPTGGGDLHTPRPPEPTSPKGIPALAVTGWNEPGASGYYTTSLFSQDDEGNLSRHTFNSSTGNWTRVSNFAVAKLGTPIAATSMKIDYYIGQPVCVNFDIIIAQAYTCTELRVPADSISNISCVSRQQ